MPNVVKKNISGLLLFDKSVGDSSNQALQKIKRIFNAKKVGHTGTLDPLASGLLPLMFGHATKFASSLLEATKTYEATVKLGFKSSTGDAEGVLVPAQTMPDQLDLTLEKVLHVASTLLGEQQQLPPMYSALKYQGKPLYEFARQGLEIDRKARTIFIQSLGGLTLNRVNDEWLVRFEVSCSKGTYVRTLAEQLANCLGTEGYLVALRRTKIAQFDLKYAVGLSQIQMLFGDDDALQRLLLPIDSLLSNLARKQITPCLAQRFIQGQRLVLQADQDQPGRHSVYCNSESGLDQFIGTGILELHGDHALLRPERIIQDIQENL